jgi:bifunctional non-homologous end joining protein LigD
MPAVYSARAKPQPTITTPLTWAEVEAGMNPTDFTILTMKERIQEKGDLFKQITTEKQNQPLDEILRFLTSQ